MTILLAVIIPLAVLVVPAVTGVLLARSRARQDLLHEPHCRQCNAALGFEAAAGLSPCTGCGRPVSETGDPSVGRRRRRWLPIVLALACMATSWGLSAFATHLAARRMSTVATLGSRSTTYIMTEALAGRTFFANDGVELVRRERAGEDVVGIARAELAAAIDLQTAATADGTIGVLPAVSSSDGPSRVAAIAFCGPRILAGGAGAGPSDLDTPGVQALARKALIACFPSLLLEWRRVPNGGVVVQPRYTGFEAPNGDVRRIIVVRAVEVDGVDVPFESLSAPDRGGPILLRSDRPFQLPTTEPASGRVARVHCVLHLYDGLDADRIADAGGKLLPRERWPRALATSEITLEVTLDEARLPASGAAP